MDCPKVHIRFLITKFYSASIYKFFSSFVNFACFASTHPDRDEALFLSNSLGEKFNFFYINLKKQIDLLEFYEKATLVFPIHFLGLAVPVDNNSRSM